MTLAVCPLKLKGLRASSLSLTPVYCCAVFLGGCAVVQGVVSAPVALPLYAIAAAQCNAERMNRQEEPITSPVADKMSVRVDKANFRITEIGRSETDISGKCIVKFRVATSGVPSFAHEIVGRYMRITDMPAYNRTQHFYLRAAQTLINRDDLGCQAKAIILQGDGVHHVFPAPKPSMC